MTLFEDEYPYEFPVDESGKIAPRLTWRERAVAWLRRRFGKEPQKIMEVMLLTTQQISVRVKGIDIRGDVAPHGPVVCESSAPEVATITVDPEDTGRVIIAGQTPGRTRIRISATGSTFVADVLVLGASID